MIDLRRLRAVRLGSWHGNAVSNGIDPTVLRWPAHSAG